MGGVSVSADVPFNPEPTKEGILQRLRDRVDGDGSTDEEDVLRAAQDAADRIQRLRREVEPAKVALAGLSLIVLLGLLLSGWYWVLPRDGLTLDTVYIQNGGHILMSEIHNSGSRAVTDLEVTVSFEDEAGEELGRMSVFLDVLSAHSSVAGDDLEMKVVGHTVWANYTVQTTVSWTDYDGASHQEMWRHDVGTWASEEFSDRTDRRTWPF
ncbi:MAG: hypothetical protein CMB41_04335 [Euryarchaeota archaeon]|nr:hypothetical protein [Euryarchaeota archaeon]